MIGPKFAYTFFMRLKKGGGRGAPAFFLGVQDSDGQTIKVLRMIYGVHPYVQFQEAIEAALRESKK